MALPAEVSYFTLTGKLVRTAPDGADGDAFPDALPLVGQIVAKAEIGLRNKNGSLKGGGRVTVGSATPKLTVVVADIPFTLDSAGAFSVSMVDPRDESLTPHGWAITLDFSGLDVAIPSFAFDVPEGVSTLDIATVTPVDLTGGVVAFVNEAAASAASAAASAASAAASAALVGVPADVAMSIIVGNPASATYATVFEMIGDAVGTTPDVGFDIVLLLGQSNAQGAATDFVAGVAPDNVPAKTYQYGATASTPRGGAGAITLASDPLVNRYTQAPPDTMGPGMAFARAYTATMGAGRKLLLIPAAYSGTGFGRVTHAPEVDLTWRVDPLPGSISLYESAIAQTLAAVAAAGANARIVAVLWVQGENDELQVPATYQGYLDAVIAGFRAQFNLPTLPFIIGSMCPEGLVGNPGRTAIDAVHQATPARVFFTAFATGTAAMFKDSGLHYNAAGQRAQGTKLFNAIATAMANSPAIPGQVTGLTAGTPGATFVPLSWAATATATNYVVEYKATSSGTWLAGGTFAATNATISALPGSTSHDFRVHAINAGGSGALSSTATASTIAAGYLLSDLTAPAARAYGTRKLHASYTGPAIRIRRTSDSTETDIGFAANVLDTAAISTFVGAGSGYVTKWYDQSGNGRDLAQTSAAAQPRIMLNGVVDVANTKPILILGANAFMGDSAAGMYAAGSATVCVVGKGPATANGRVIAEGSSTANVQQYVPMMSNTTTAALISQRIVNDAGTSIAADVATTSAFSATLAQITVQDSGLAFKKRVNGADADTFGYTRAGAVTLDLFALGTFNRLGGATAFAAVPLSEVIVFYSDISTPDRAAVETSQKAYYATP